MRVLLVALTAAVALAGCAEPTSAPKATATLVPVGTVVNRCANVRDLVVVDKRPSNQYIGSRVYWCQNGFLAGGEVYDDSLCWSQSQLGQRRPIACENAR